MENNKNNKDNKRKNIIDWIIKIILIIIIILLLIHNCGLSRNRANTVVPTGNVDIIEITCDKDTSCIVEPVSGNTIDDGGSNNQGKPSTPSEDAENTEDGDLIVYDQKITWDGYKEADIFKQTMYVKEGRIAPESSNTYQFVVKNSSSYNFKYNIDFVETNPHSINMKYKLKKNDTYLIDHYVSASELNVADMLLNAGENDTYYLEWKWISASNDTEIGMMGNAQYGLKIEVKAESTNG